jgi:hypothetical protein
VKAPEAEIWIVKKSVAAAEELLQQMRREKLRVNRYNVAALDGAMLEEMCSLAQSRNNILWVKGGLEQREAQFDFNGLWFEMPLATFRF